MKIQNQVEGRNHSSTSNGEIEIGRSNPSEVDKFIFQRSRKSTMGKGWKVTKATLPLSLVNEVESISSDPNEAHRAMRCIHIIYMKSSSLDKPTGDLLVLSDNYKNLLLNGNTKYRYIFAKLEERGILINVPLENGKGFSWGRNQAKRYKINEKYLYDSNMTTFYYERRSPSDKSIQKQVNSLDTVERKTYEVLQKLELSIDEDKIDATIRKKKNKVLKKVKQRTYLTKKGEIRYQNGTKVEMIDPKRFQDKDEFIEFKTNQILQIYIYRLRAIANKDFLKLLPSRDNKGQRLYHVLSNLPSLCLQYIRLNGERLYEIDKKNSQLNLLANILIRCKSDTGMQLGEEVFGILSSSFNKSLSLPYLSYHFSSVPPNYKGALFMSEELEEWFLSSFQGKAYEHMSMKMSQSKEVNGEIREEMKVTVFGMLFGDYRYSMTSEKKKQLRLAFPRLTWIVDDIKKYAAYKVLETNETNGPEYQWHKVCYNDDADKAGSDFLSIALQRIEVLIFVERILNRLLGEGYLVLSKHDSFLVPESQKDEVFAIVKSELLDIFGEDENGPRFSLREPVECRG